MDGRVLLLGGTGLIGRALTACLGPERAVATHRDHPADDSLWFDSTASSVESLLDQVGNPGHAVLLFAESRTVFCSKHPEEAAAINIGSSIRTLDALKKRGIKPVFLSSDGVFDGRGGNYTETDTPHPLMEYGKQKLAVEHHLTTQFDDYLIVRPTRVLSTQPGEGAIFDSWLAAIRDKTVIQCADDHHFCPIAKDDLAKLIVALIDGGAKGIFHAGGPDAVTHWSLLQSFIAALGVKRATIQAVAKSINDFDVGETRPLNTTLNSEKARALTGLVPATPGEVCREYAEAVKRQGGFENG